MFLTAIGRERPQQPEQPNEEAHYTPEQCGKPYMTSSDITVYENYNADNELETLPLSTRHDPRRRASSDVTYVQEEVRPHVKDISTPWESRR